jgi:guanylate kinase
MIIIIGTSGSGKDYLCNKISKSFFYEKTLINTSRKRRNNDNDNYIYLEKEELLKKYKSLKEDKKFFFTEFNGNLYFNEIPSDNNNEKTILIGSKESLISEMNRREINFEKVLVIILYYKDNITKEKFLTNERFKERNRSFNFIIKENNDNKKLAEILKNNSSFNLLEVPIKYDEFFNYDNIEKLIKIFKKTILK